MSQEVLAIIWFALWAVLWMVYFALDGYTLGTGILFPFLSKSKQEELQLQETIGPYWNVNEVWVITAGGATFAAFPLTYALMFSYLYVPLFLILFALFFRAIGLEFMHKHEDPKWKTFWKWAFFAGSAAVALLWGVAFANLFQGLLIDANGSSDTLLTLLNPYGLIGGLTFVSLFALSGSLWIAFKVKGDVEERAWKLSKTLWAVAAAIYGIFLIATAAMTPLLHNFVTYPVLFLVPALALAALLLVRFYQNKGRKLAAFLSLFGTILLTVATGFIGLFPNMLLSKIDPKYSITLFQAAASQKTLTIMFIVAVVMVPIIIAYQLWTYFLFKEKITIQNARGYHQ
ncbi:Cytochrome bd-type quinol oxidase, subunit 2 [[Clostridium] ultunense Esp]|uniref:cytochrome d ubiquinol oxidase subunit II n=1 Tax=Thermicanus aegyptius TaxID=94009 RepID=UPI0002B705B4|nr:cytochrome d ubiquinol oxidase subunit II [Thermicanus aegyptius]CCQ95667.1 Cytochrome bd-type quinol oxidase, subunit 2 [[Clostridium] ultunense Esp]